MKKLLLFVTCFAFQLTVHAQLKVHSNGNVSISNPQSFAYSPLSLGTTGNSKHFMTCRTNRNGAYFSIRPDSLSTTLGYGGKFLNFGLGSSQCHGIKGFAQVYTTQGTSEIPVAIGVRGGAYNQNTLSGLAFGVIGSFAGGKGVAICGKAYDSTDETAYVDRRYAGLFLGETMVAGNLTVTGTFQGTMLGYAAPSDSFTNSFDSTEGESTLGKFSGLKVTSYYVPSTEEDKNPVLASTSVVEQSVLPEDSESVLSDIPQQDEQPDEDIMQKQLQSKMHYALAAEQLEKVFPDLVYEEKDGTKRINYMEMIPLLVQSINELQSQINVLTGKESAKKAPAASSVSGQTAVSQARLYQNTPNPFTERTEIRFSLPDDTRNAQICIFDMSGKMLRQTPVDAGMKSIVINGYELAAGMYLYSLVIGGQEVDTKRMILSK